MDRDRDFCDSCGRVAEFDSWAPVGWFDLTFVQSAEEGIGVGLFCSLECMRHWVSAKRFHEILANSARHAAAYRALPGLRDHDDDTIETTTFVP